MVDGQFLRICSTSLSKAGEVVPPPGEWAIVPKRLAQRILDSIVEPINRSAGVSVEAKPDISFDDFAAKNPICSNSPVLTSKCPNEQCVSESDIGL